MIPLSVPNLEGNEEKYVLEALKQGWVSTGGPAVNELENSLSDFLKVEHAVACQSGTSGIHLSLIECGIKPGDLVIVPTLTFIAAVNPVRYCFAEPIFMDCDESFCIDPLKLREFCTNECHINNNNLIHNNSGKIIKALIAVHVFGNMADMESIMQISKDFHLKVIEDATEALGTHYTDGFYKGKHAGTIGDFGVFSFNGNKIITTGGGGAVTSKSEAAISHIRYLSTQAKDDPLYYIHNEIGYNYRMTNLQAALGVAQMEELPEFIRRKNVNYDLYAKYFNNINYAYLHPFRSNTYSNKWFYALQISRSYIKTPLKEIITRLQNLNIQTRPIWGLIHEQAPYKDFFAYKIEKAKIYGDSIINLPCSTNITESEIGEVADKIVKLLGDIKNG